MDRRKTKYPICVNCNNSFGFNYRDIHQPTNPLLLQCGHSLCQGCVTSKLKSEGGSRVQCKVCSAISGETFDKESDLRKNFPLSTYLVGQVVLKRFSNSKIRDNVLGFFPQKNKMETEIVRCVECSISKADCECLKCDGKFCHPCFDKVHSIGKTLKTHVKSPLKSVENTLLSEDIVCQQHAENFFEFYCNNCSIYCCKECCIENHLGCSCISISEMNKPYLPEFAEMYEEASAVLKQLYSTQKKVRQEEEKTSCEEVSEVQNQVMMHFSKLHGLLQLQEESILKQIRKLESQATESLASIGVDLGDKIQEMENLLTRCKASMENEHHKNIPLKNLLEKLKNVTEMPCYLVSRETPNSLQVKFTVDEEIVNRLEKHCNVSLPQKVEFELLSKSNLPEGYNIEPISDELPEFNNFVKNTNIKIQMMTPITQKVLPKPGVLLLPQAEVKTKKSVNNSFLESLGKNRQKFKGPFGTLSASPTIRDNEALPTIAPLKEGMREVVMVSHLNSPSDFYILRKSCQKMSEKITEYFSKQSNIRKDPPATVDIGEMYIHQFNTDKKWYRCVVKNFQSRDKCTVFYIDYGNMETTYKKKLRDVPEEFLKIPPLACHCKLFGCSPINGEWKLDARELMCQMVNNEELSCFVERACELSDLLEVRLTIQNSANDNKDVEVNQAFIFLELAHWNESVKSEIQLYKEGKYNKKTKTFVSDVPIQKAEIFEAIVSHVVSPSHFYIQKRQFVHFLRDFDKLYSRLGPNDSLVYQPAQGMLVAVKSAEDQTWKRGVVINTPKPCTVTVQMIDYGNNETVHWKNVRQLDKCHMKTASQAIKCKLSDVASKFDKVWTKSATAAFQQLAPKNKIFKVYVEDVKDSYLKVLLYETLKNKEVNINGKLVQMGHALSVGASSRTDEYPIGPNDNDDKDSLCSISTNLVNSKSSHSITSLPQDEYFKDINTGSFIEGSVFSEEKSQISVLSDPETATHGSVKSSGHFEEDINSKFIKVQAVKILSPAEIYMTSERLQKHFEKLKSKMTDFYRQCTEEEQCWKVGDVCAALRNADDTWYRGIIKDVSSDNCKVFMSDIAEVEDVEIKDLRILKEQFTKQCSDITFKCFLTGIIPPGGMSTWPGSTNDHLKVLINNHPDLYIQAGPVEEGVLPVKMYSKIEKVIGALEPAVVDYMDISQQLRDAGLALPQRIPNQNSSAAPLSSHLGSGDLLPNFDMQKPKVQEWLQSEFEAANAQMELDQEKACGMFEFLEDPRTMKRAPPKRDQKHTRPTYIPVNQKQQPNEEKTISLPKIPTKIQSTVKKWLPAEPFKKLEFISLATNVDYDCGIYIQDMNASRETLKLLKASLLACFETTHPKPHDLTWSEGQICVAKYDVDGNWYRAIVTKVEVDYNKVLFVDYGNIEEVKPCNMRKDVVMFHIPIQCHKCYPVGMIPNSDDGKWPVKTLDLIHHLVVEKECRVKLKPPALDGDCYTIVEMTLPSGETLLKTLLSLNFATYVVDCEALTAEHSQLDEIEEFISDPDYPIEDTFKVETSIEELTQGKSPKLHSVLDFSYDWHELGEKEQESLQTGITFEPTLSSEQLHYKSLQIPDSLVEITVEVGIVVAYNTLRIRIADCDDTELKKFNYQFTELHEKIQEEAESLLPIVKPIVGLPCIGCYTEDSEWYRAEIIQIIDDTHCKVHYVDYGNEEEVSINRLREIKVEYMALPAQSIQVYLHNIFKGPEYNKQSTQTMMMNCFNANPYMMTLERKYPHYQVNIFNEKGERPYQKLLDYQLLAEE